MGIYKEFIYNIGPLGIIWFIGIFLIVISISLLGILIPLKDKVIEEKKKEITDMEYKRDIRLRDNWQDYQRYVTKEKMIRLTYKYFKDTNAPEKDLKDLYAEYLEARREAIGKLYIITAGEIPSDELFKEWAKMTMEQLLDKDKEMRPQAEKNIKKLLDEIKKEKEILAKLESSKTNIIVTATVIQVIALVLINATTFFKKR